jgi:hypothetical protein
MAYEQEEATQPAQLPAPSQKIIYEDESLREERLKLIKRLGGTLADEVEVARGESIGIVKDKVVGDGAAGRSRRRR